MLRSFWMHFCGLSFLWQAATDKEWRCQRESETEKQFGCCGTCLSCSGAFTDDDFIFCADLRRIVVHIQNLHCNGHVALKTGIVWKQTETLQHVQKTSDGFCERTSKLQKKFLGTSSNFLGRDDYVIIHNSPIISSIQPFIHTFNHSVVHLKCLNNKNHLRKSNLLWDNSNSEEINLIKKMYNVFMFWVTSHKDSS